MRGKLAEYVVMNNPRGASNLLTQYYNMPRTRSMRQMVQQMNYIIKHHRQKALEDIMTIHPDKEIFNLGLDAPATASAQQVMKEAVAEPTSSIGGDCEGCEKLEKKSNCGGGCSGCSGDCGCGCGGNCKGTSNASGCGCGGATSSIAGMNYAADGNGDASKSDKSFDTTTPMSKESNVSKAITFLSAGVVGVIVAGIIFKKF
jgi:hypothetical protein